MGVVYKAEDTKLKRTVALKFLPTDLTCDPEAKERFVQEAQAASALDHPNICTIHEIGETDDGQMFITMACYEGRSLKQVIDDHPISIDDCIHYTLQIAQGLQKAHEKGIVHRDIKPANIIITNDGVVKILDFGLAKLAGQSRITKTGSTVGTVAYMSPEQVQGRDVDHQTDIWSLGVVLFEMLTGKLPFNGEHEAALLYLIVNSEPERITKWRDNILPALETLIDRALEKDTKYRYRTVTEFASELKRIQRRSDHVATGTHTGNTPTSRTMTYANGIPARSRKHTMMGLVISAVLLATVGTWFLIKRSTPHPPALNPQFTFRTLKVQFTEIGSPAISADGNWIVFPAGDKRGKWGLYFMNASGTDVRPVSIDTTGDRIMDVDISPDGNSLVFNRWETRENVNGSSLYIVPVTGGSPRRVDDGLSPRWRCDGQRFGYIKHTPFTQSASGNREFWTASNEGRNLHLEFIDSAGIKSFGIVPFAWSSDGKRIIWGRSITEGSQELFLRDLETGREQQITQGKASIIDISWARENAIIYVSDKSGFYNLWMVASNGGEATRITPASLNQLQVRCSAGGKRVLYLQQETSWSLHATMVGTNRSQILLSGESKIGHFDPSPDGTEIAFETRDEGHNKIVVLKRDGTDRREVMQSDSAIAIIRWSSDGKFLAYTLFPADAVSRQNLTDSLPVYVVNPHSVEFPRIVTNGLLMTWPDSATLLIYHKTCSYLYPLNGSPPKKFFKDSTVSFPVVGGKYALYSIGEGDRKSFWITRIDGTGPPRRLTRRESGETWAFSPDNSYITVLTNNKKLFRMHFPDGRIEYLPVMLPDSSESRALGEFNINRSGKEVFYTLQRRLFRMVIIDKVFADE